MNLETKPKYAINMARIISGVTRAARLTPGEAARLARSRAAEILVHTAFLAGCDDPERTAVSHLCILMAAVREKELFEHRPGETLAHRLGAISHFPYGNPSMVKAGLLLLELLSLNDHTRDLADDILVGKPNPLILEMDRSEERERILFEYYSLPISVRRQFEGLFDKTIEAGIWL